jgi:hypothetical protein
MGDETSEHSTHFCWGHFAREMSVKKILYNILWAQADERRTRIFNPAEKKSWVQYRLNP